MHSARWRARGLTIPAPLAAAYCDCRVRPFLLALDTQGEFRAAPAAIAHQRLELRDGPILCDVAPDRVRHACARRHAKAGSSNTRPTAAAILAGEDPGRSRRPAPDATTRAATSGWSRPIGIATRGTPCAKRLDHRPMPRMGDDRGRRARSTWPCGAEATTVTFGGASTSSGATAGPVVTSPRTGSATERGPRRAPASTTWSWYVELVPTSTSGSSPGGGVHSLHPIGVVEARAHVPHVGRQRAAPGKSNTSLVSATYAVRLPPAARTRAGRREAVRRPGSR